MVFEGRVDRFTVLGDRSGEVHEGGDAAPASPDQLLVKEFFAGLVVEGGHLAELLVESR